MQTKDYYKILGLPPSATFNEIKSAYRRLAHQFHPDKSGHDPYAASQFEIVKEAYEVLTNPSKKAFYLQQRWYDQVMNKKPSVNSVTPATVVKQCIELDQYVSRLDVYRMDQQGLYSYIADLLSDETIDKLNSFKEKDVNDIIIDSILKASRSLPLSYTQLLSGRLMKLTAGPGSVEKISSSLAHARRAHRWTKYKIWMLLVIAALICYLIFALSA